MFTKESQLLFLTREDYDQFGEHKGLNRCLRVPFHPVCLSSNWILLVALFFQLMMQAVCFGLIENYEIEAVYNAILALGIDCLCLVFAMLQINVFVMCDGVWGQTKFDEK